jgi:hypothetical protein
MKWSCQTGDLSLLSLDVEDIVVMTDFFVSVGTKYLVK